MALVFSRTISMPITGQDSTSGESDTHLVSAAQADPRAFGPLYERYHDLIYRYCYTRLGSREAAEDAAADVFLKALTNLHQYRRDGAFAAWLYTIARHAVADFYQKHRPTEPWDDAGGTEAGLTAENRTGKQIERTALMLAMADLSDEQRSVLELQLSGWSGAEIAAALGKSVAAVKMIRYRALGRLQQLLGQES